MRFTTRFPLPVERESLFAFHEDPWNLRVLLAGWSRTTVLATEGHIRPGARTEVLERFGPLRLRLVFEHFLHEPPERFGERMVRGPFRRFEHVHRFLAVRSDPAALPSAEIEDEVQFEVPVWLGGELSARLFVLPRLRRFFEFRRRAYERLAAAGRFGPAAEPRR